jgi:hypothetical protein
MANFDHKLVAIVNKELESGVAMNALAHMSLGLGAALDGSALHLNDYIDSKGNHCPTNLINPPRP